MLRLRCAGLAATALTMLAVLAGIGAPLRAQSVPASVTYQGRLTNAQSPAGGTVSMQFAIFDAQTGGSRLWREPDADGAGVSVVVSQGLFTHVLGSAVALPPSVFSGPSSTRYLEIIINPGASQEVLSPRQALTTTPYAARAERSAGADTVTDGVYTTGSYADPVWITSLAAGKISGTVGSATSAASFTGSLAGDVIGVQGATEIAGSAQAGTHVVTALNNPGAAGTITSTRLPAMAGATPSSAGATGLVPQPLAGDESKVLHGDGTWGTKIGAS